jgi:hypothetical protein
MSDLEMYIKAMESSHPQALEEDRIELAEAISFCILTAKKYLKNIEKGEK